ncbi:alpha/beta fold hydrolase [Thermodesulfobacteriota bacterium]
MKPSIQFAKRNDGVKIAYSIIGKGFPLVIAPPWTTSLRYIIEDPYMNHFIEQLAQRVMVIFYDKHGCGQSDRDREVFTLESELIDLETIVNHLDLDIFNLLGSSMAGPISIGFTARHPKKVDKLVLYGTYADGEKLAPKKVQRAISSLIEASWGLGSKTLADVFTPDATAEELKSHARYQRLSTSAEIAIKILELCYTVDVTETLSLIKTPTLILHREDDKAVPIHHGRELSTGISNSTFCILSGNAHPMWHGDSSKIAEEILEFLGEDRPIKATNISTEQRITRKLRAILSADVKGYSILMADDEVTTIKTLKEYRSIMSGCIDQHGGRVVDAVGDNLLADFGSAVDAIQCAVEVQKELKDKNQDLPKDKRLEFRIGINIGDVVQEGDRIYGNGVNVAARIEGLSDPGGICISRGTYDQVKDKLDVGFEYLGEHEVKNINEPVRVYKVLLDFDPPKPLVKEKLELPDKPSIAVLPFDNMSGDPDQEYFSDGLTEQIINGLCKVSNLFVIARNSSFAYKGKSISIKQVAKELGVRYILEGSVQRAGDRVRITAQLIDATTDYHMWSENYDRDLTDIFALQDEITMKLIFAMEINLTAGKQARLWEGGTTNIQAYDRCMRGNDCLSRNNEKDNKQAQQFYKEAINIDGAYAMPYGMLGFTHIFDLLYRWSKAPLQSFEEAEKNVEKAHALNDSLDMAHSLLGWIYLFKRQHDMAIKEGERAIELNPNGAVAHAQLAFILCLSDETELAIKLLKRAFRLDPIPPPHFYIILAMAYRNNGQYEKAIELSERGLVGNPDQLSVYLTLAASYYLLGQTEEAHKAVEEVLRIDPNFSLEYQAKAMPYKHQETGEKFVEALRKAGLPE